MLAMSVSFSRVPLPLVRSNRFESEGILGVGQRLTYQTHRLSTRCAISCCISTNNKRQGDAYQSLRRLFLLLDTYLAGLFGINTFPVPPLIPHVHPLGQPSPEYFSSTGLQRKSRAPDDSWMSIAQVFRARRRSDLGDSSIKLMGWKGCTVGLDELVDETRRRSHVESVDK